METVKDKPVKKIKSVTFFPNGNSMVFDEQGNQIPELQEAWIILWLKHAESLGYDPTECKDIQLPHGRFAQPFKTSEGNFNWQTVDF